MISERNPNCPKSWTGGHPCHSGKEMAAFGLCPENLCEVKFKASKLICLVEKNSRLERIQAKVWLLLSVLTQDYFKKAENRYKT